MPEIEFLEPADLAEPAPAPADEPGPSGPTRWRARLLGALPVAFWLAAGALSVAASFATVYAVRVSGIEGFRYANDGWGRLRGVDGVPSSEHGIRFGIALCVAAGLFLAAAGLRLTGELRARPRLVRAGTLVGAGAATFLAGIVSTVLLQLQGLADNIDGQRQGGPPTAMSVGGTLWFGVAALGCALAAGLVGPALARRPRTPAATPVRLALEPVEHPDDEVLADTQ